MSDDLWAGGMEKGVWLEAPPDWRDGHEQAAVFINVEMGDGDLLTPDGCRSLAAALIAAADRKEKKTP